jgi:nucleoside-diphosphate-sugar epimerase/UDP-N-acetylglucosamine:LPS N-acetylglucosamine transferase
VRVLVTGGAGFIGSHVVDKLLEAGHEPLIFDLRASPYHSPAEVEQLAGDVTDGKALLRAARGRDVAIHLAAVANVADVVARPGQAQRSNAQGTLEVLEAAREVGLRRVLYGSTTWVYSDCVGPRVDEDTPLATPSHLYTATKLAGELYCKAYRELFGIEYTVLRFGIPYGPRAREATVVAALTARAENGEPLTIAGAGRQVRRFVYVEDLAEGVVAALRPEAADRVYNLAGDQAVTVLEIAEAVRSGVRDTGIVHTPARSADFDGRHVSSERAERELDWTAKTSFADGFRRYLAWRRVRNHPRRVLILSADIGEGHDLPARALATGLRTESPGVQVRVVDGLRAMGRLMTLLIRDGSWLSFNWLPWLFEAQYFLVARFPPTRWLALKLGCLLCGRSLRKAIRADDPDVIVSTYPGTTAVLGELRRRGRLQVPVVSAITDLAGLRFWAHPGVDLHTITHRESTEEVEQIAGPGRARWAQPPTSREFLAPRSKLEARHRLALPDDGKVVVVSGGGWGIGDLAGAVRAALEVEASAVVCLSGHSARARRRLERRFGSNARVRLLGFTDRMSDLLAAADALVHSTAGLTVLEAQIRGCPVISYGFAVGHIRANNRAYRRFGLARVATSSAALRRELDRAFAERRSPDPAFAALPSAAQLVLEAKTSVRPLPAGRLRALRIAAATALTFLAAGVVLLSDDTYPLFAKMLHASPMTTVATFRPEAGVLVDASPEAAPRLARQMARRGVSASFALEGAPTRTTLGVLRGLGDEALPKLGSGGPFHSLETRDRLSHAAVALGLGRNFLYEPDNDFSIGQYLLAHAAGGSPVRGATQVDPGDQVGNVRRGEIVEMSSNIGSPAWASTLDSLDRRLASGGLRGVPVSELVGSGGD